MSSEFFIKAVSATTVIYTCFLIGMVSVSNALQKPFIKEGHYAIAVFGMLDLYVSNAIGQVSAFYDNITMSVVALFALPMYILKGKQRVKLLIAVHVLVLFWLASYIYVIFAHPSGWSLFNACILLGGVVSILYGWSGEYRKGLRPFLLRDNQ